ncbi:Probable plastidic glucose transporter 3 [Linum perenne]
MRGRHLENSYYTYKRLSSKEFVDSYDDREDDSDPIQTSKDIGNPPWRRSLMHILVATISSFLFGYHLGVVNETLESMSVDLGFSGNTMAEGGAFIGSLFSGWVADGAGRRRAFQLCALPMIIGASMSATTNNLWGMLLGRLFVGTGMGLGPPVAALYVAEVSPAHVRGTFGSLTQTATCLGLMGSLYIGFPAKTTMGWWRVCFWVSVIPAASLVILMQFCAESPYWLLKRGRSAEAEIAFEKLLGALHVKSAMAELSKSNRGDEVENAVSMGIQAVGATSFVSSSQSVYLSVGGMLMVVLSFALGAAPVPGLLLSEILPSRIRAKAMAFCMAVHWVVNFFVGLLFLRLLEQIGAFVLYTIFSSFCLLAVIFVKKNVLETKGRSLQEIEIALLSQV